MKEMIYLKKVCLDTLMVYPPKNLTVFISYYDTYKGKNYYSIKGYEFNSYSDSQVFSEDEFAEPSITNEVTKELAEEVLRKDKQIEIERVLA